MNVAAAGEPVAIRPLDQSAGTALLAANRACPLEADFTFRFDREPDFFAWPAAVFDSAEYQGAFIGDRLAGYCVAGLRTGWVGQGWGRWAYTAVELMDGLWERSKVRCRAVGDPYGVRQCCHIYCFPEDVDRTLATARQMAAARR